MKIEIVKLVLHNFKGQKHLEVSLNPGINKIEGQNASGKAQPYNAKVLTINGFVNLGSIKIGDEIYTADGTLTKVTGVFPQGLKDCYKITLLDGRQTRCCNEHLWTVYQDVQGTDTNYLKTRTISLNNIINIGLRKGKGWRFGVPNNSAVIMPESDLPIHPYVLGVLLGDGYIGEAANSPQISNPEIDIIDRVQALLGDDFLVSKSKGQNFTWVISDKTNFRKNALTQYLNELGLREKSKGKFIPMPYLFGSIEQRRELLAGLFDTDGCVQITRKEFNKRAGHSYRFCTASEQLAHDTAALCRGLGYQCHLTEQRRGYKGTTYNLTIFTRDIIFKSEKHKARWQEGEDARNINAHYNSYKTTKIIDVAYVGREEMMCIQVEHPSQLYLTDDFIVTHNTTIFDAFTWALFGKDSEDRTDFNVKTLNADGEPEHHLEHFVELTLKVDEQNISFKRILEEKWTKPKGQKEAIFSGHENSYYVNEVPCSMKEYNLKVETICRPDVFKFITNPLYFPSMPWNKQREILTVIAGTMPEVQPSEALAELLGRITGKTLKEYKAEIKKKKDLAQAELDGIEPRIKENDLKKTEVLALGYDYPAIEKNITAIQHEIAGVDQAIAEVAKQKDAAGQKRMSIQQEINNLKIAQQRIETETRIIANSAGESAKMEYDRLTVQLKAKQIAKTDTEATIRSENANLTVIEKKITDLRAEWHTENDKRMNVSDDILACPTCGREFEESQVNEKKAALALKFNESKARRLAEIETEGKSLAIRKDEKTALILSLTSDLSKIETEIFELTQRREAAEEALPQEVVSITPMLESHEEYQKNLTEIARLEQSLTTITVPGVETYQAKRRELDTDLSRLNSVLSTKNTITECDTRIEQLKNDQKRLAQVIADYERDENTIMDYTRAYVRIVEERVNSMFEIARFKMFNILINGSEEETCECMVNGVPFRDLNNGMKIAVGIDIINTLSDYYHIHAPIWIDNSEAINVIPETRSQVIGLYVTEDTTLHINGKPTAKNAAPILETINA